MFILNHKIFKNALRRTILHNVALPFEEEAVEVGSVVAASVVAGSIAVCSVLVGSFVVGSEVVSSIVVDSVVAGSVPSSFSDRTLEFAPFTGNLGNIESGNYGPQTGINGLSQTYRADPFWEDC